MRGMNREFDLLTTLMTLAYSHELPEARRNYTHAARAHSMSQHSYVATRRQGISHEGSAYAARRKWQAREKSAKRNRAP